MKTFEVKFERTETRSIIILAKNIGDAEEQALNSKPDDFDYSVSDWKIKISG